MSFLNRLKNHLFAMDPNPEPAHPAMPKPADEPIPYTLAEADEDFAADGEIPADELGYWLQQARELRYEMVLSDSPVYDQVAAEAMSRDGLAAEVEAWLAGGAR